MAPVHKRVVVFFITETSYGTRNRAHMETETQQTTTNKDEGQRSVGRKIPSIDHQLPWNEVD
jgi:hypothetical protein